VTEKRTSGTTASAVTGTIRVLVVADSGAAMSGVTASLAQSASVEIIAYANGRAPLDRILAATKPDVVLIDEMRRPGLAAARVAETLAGDPLAVIVGTAQSPDSTWMVEGLRRGASAVIPRDLPPEPLTRVLGEVLAAAALRATGVSAA
jgi:DNA-binding NarL/FixJ family response regulator